MKIQQTKIKSGLLVFIMATLAGLSARADDTEIFFGAPGNIEAQPNVLIILDNSGSMTGTDGGTSTRMERMKDATLQLLDKMDKVNVGLMNFSHPGGPILYPVRDINEALVKPETLSISINGNDNDAEQAASGTVTLNNPNLAIATRSSSGTTTISTRVNDHNYDAEEKTSTGNIDFISSPSLELLYDNFNPSLEQAVGLIFRNQAIPTGAKILHASVELTIYEDSGNSQLNEPLNLEISGQTGTTNVLEFSTSNNISSRTTTTARTTWNITGQTPAAGETLTTPNLAALLQEIVDQVTWSSGQSVALFLKRPAGDTSTGSRVFAAFNPNNPTTAPLLRVTYETPITPVVQTIGLRFQDVSVPQGATITSAALEFSSASDNNDTTIFTILGENTNNAAPFTSTSSDLSSRTKTTADVTWMPGAWKYGETHNTAEAGADLKSIVQEIVNDSGWCGGNAMAFFVTGSGTRLAHSHDGNPSAAPKLKITYDPNTIPADGGCVATTQSYRIPTTQKSDDAYCCESGGWWGNYNVSNSASLNLDYKYNGFRFTNLQIPKNADILSAYIEFTASSSDSDSANYTIRIENSNNASTLSSSNTDIDDRNYRNTTAAWSSVPAWTADMTYRTPDISTLIEGVASRSGWSSGNAMMIMIEGTGNRRVITSDASDGGTKAPRLIITMRSSTGSVGGTTRDALKGLVSNMQANTWTPIVDVLYEAALYYRGGALEWGDQRRHAVPNRSLSDSDARYVRVSHEDSYTGGTVQWPAGCTADNLNSSSCINQTISGSPRYISPITSQCQTNHIVLLTDGIPTINQSESLVRSMTGDGTCENGPSSAYYNGGDYTRCAPELANFLSTNDQSNTLAGDQIIKTHTIAFNLGDASEYLDKVAEKGGTTEAKSANTAQELLDVFEKILVDLVLTTDTTFVSPGVTVNTFNRLTHRNEIYFALFRPETTPRWPGNLKRYGINSKGEILDSNDAAAIDPATGFFKASAKSYWSSSTDGNDTELGGAAENLPASGSRNVYTYFDGSPSRNLSNAANALSVANIGYITKDRLGITGKSDTYHQNLINWARGLDPSTNTERKRLADPLHSVPHLVTYGGTDSDPDITIFYADNEGFLHAINAKDGTEQFSFIPEALLPNLQLQYDNSANTPHPYGLDGPINSWAYDANGDLQLKAADGDSVMVYVGMRRGGRNYYGLNVTNRNAPRLEWIIQGGSGDYAELGQTWSKPIKTKVDVSGTVREVLIFAGGYDANQDNASLIAPDSMGRAVYIADALTGAKIWSAGPTNVHNLEKSAMLYSIPSTVRVLDTNSDGLADQMYVGDVGGQLWRFDIHNGSSTSQLVTGDVIADVSGTTTSTARRFYHEPDVSVIVENNRRKLAIAIGSGYHAHPLNSQIQDRIYMFKQDNVTSAPEDGPDAGNDLDYVLLSESDLYDATANLLAQDDTNTQAVELAKLALADGWFITLKNDPGEKVLSTPLAVAGELFVTSYSPATQVIDCRISNGTSRLYRIGLDAPKYSVTTLKTVGLPADPAHLRILDPIPDPPVPDPDPGSEEDEESIGEIICVGTECFQIGSGANIIKTYWYNN